MKKKRLSCTLLLALIVGFSVVCISETTAALADELAAQQGLFAARDGLVQFEQNGSFGLMNSEGKVLLPARYEEIHPFFIDGYSWCRKGDAYYLIDKEKGRCSDTAYAGLGVLQSGLIPAKIGMLWGYINTAEEWVIKPRFEWCSAFDGNLAYGVSSSGGEIFDKNGQILLGQADLSSVKKELKGDYHQLIPIGMDDGGANYQIDIDMLQQMRQVPDFMGSPVCFELISYKDSQMVQTRWGFVTQAGEVVLLKKNQEYVASMRGSFGKGYALIRTDSDFAIVFESGKTKKISRKKITGAEIWDSLPYTSYANVEDAPMWLSDTVFSMEGKELPWMKKLVAEYRQSPLFSPYFYGYTVAGCRAPGSEACWLIDTQGNRMLDIRAAVLHSEKLAESHCELAATEPMIGVMIAEERLLVQCGLWNKEAETSMERVSMLLDMDGEVLAILPSMYQSYTGIGLLPLNTQRILPMMRMGDDGEGFPISLVYIDMDDGRVIGELTWPAVECERWDGAVTMLCPQEYLCHDGLCIVGEEGDYWYVNRSGDAVARATLSVP